MTKFSDLFEQPIPPELRQDWQEFQHNRRNVKPDRCWMCQQPKTIISSHTVSRSLLRRIAKNSKVITLSSGRLNREGTPEVVKLQGVRSACTFKMLCHDCDQRFQPADNFDFDRVFERSHQGRLDDEDLCGVFLWHYRALLREAYWKLIDLIQCRTTLRSEDLHNQMRMFAGLRQAAALSFLFGQREWQTLYEQQAWGDIHIRGIRLLSPPTVSASATWCFDDIYPFHPGLATVTVAPTKVGVVILWVSSKEDAAGLDSYLARHNVISDDYDPIGTRLNLSRILWQDIEVMALSPEYWDSLGEAGQEACVRYFKQTLTNAVEPEPEDWPLLNLFPERDRDVP